MKKVFTTLRKFSQDRPAFVLAILALVSAVLGLWARFYHLGAITQPIFDEVYFPVFARDFLHHKIDFDVHPPLGKFLLAIGIWLFPDGTFGERIVPAVFGVAIIALTVWLWRLYKGSLVGVLLLISFLSLDGILIVYSRTGLIDGILLFFILLSFALAVRMKEGKDAIWISTALGLAVAVKWIALGVFVPILYIAWRKKLIIPFLCSLPWGIWVYLLITVGAQVIGGVANPWQAMVDWHNQALEYHLKLTATHPWSSPWWTWPLLLRPVLFWYQVDGDKTTAITALGNPFLWWSSAIAVIIGAGSVIRAFWREKKAAFDHPLLPLLIGYGSFWLPWALVHRVVFIYHYIPAYIFAVLILVYELEWLWRKAGAWSVVTLATIFAIVGIYFFPWTVGLPINQKQMQERTWIGPSKYMVGNDPDYITKVWWHGWMTN